MKIKKEEVIVDYGPLKILIGTWQGSKGIDIAPDSKGTEKNPYFEKIVFEEAGDLSNAERQKLAIVRYHQVVQRKSNNEVFHDQIGYYLWDAQSKTITHTFVIPRGVGVVALGKATTSSKEVKIKVSAKASGKNPGITQAPFMAKNAKSLSFEATLIVSKTKLVYSEKTKLKIYGKLFNHTDDNTLHKVK